MSTRTVLDTPFDTRLFEFTGVVDSDSSPAHCVVPTRSEVTVQVMSVTGAPTVGINISLNLDGDSPKVWDRATGVKAPATDIALTDGQAETVLQSGHLIRPIITAGTSVSAVVRIKAERVR